MATKEFILQRISIFTDKDFDPSDDKQVKDVLRSQLNIHLPQRTSLNDALSSTISDHEIISLILQYRTMDQ